MCPRIFRQHFDFSTFSTRTYQPRPRRINTSPQRRRDPQTKKDSVFKRDDWLSKAYDLHLTPRDSISYYKHHHHATASGKSHGTPLLAKTMQRVLVICLNVTCMAAPLNAKLQKDQPKTRWPLNNEELKSMKLLIDALISLRFLAVLNFSGHPPPRYRHK